MVIMYKKIKIKLICECTLKLLLIFNSLLYPLCYQFMYLCLTPFWQININSTDLIYFIIMVLYIYILLKYWKHFRDLVDVMSKFQGWVVDAAGGLAPVVVYILYMYIDYCWLYRKFDIQTHFHRPSKLGRLWFFPTSLEHAEVLVYDWLAGVH